MLPAKCQRNIIPLEIYSNDCVGTIGFYEFESVFIVNYDNGSHSQRNEINWRWKIEKKAIFLADIEAHSLILGEAASIHSFWNETLHYIDNNWSSKNIQKICKSNRFFCANNPISSPCHKCIFTDFVLRTIIMQISKWKSSGFLFLCMRFFFVIVLTTSKKGKQTS